MYLVVHLHTRDAGMALMSHQCGLGSTPLLGVIRGLSLLVLYSTPRGFSLGTLVSPSPQKQTFDLNCINC